MSVKRIIAKNNVRHFFISPDAWIATAVTRIQKTEAAALMVSYDGRFIEGIISEHDIVNGLSRHGSGILKMRVLDLMSEEVVTCQTTDSVMSVMQKMVTGKIRHLPVLNSAGKFEGLITIQDIIIDRLEQHEHETKQMLEDISSAVPDNAAL